MPKTCPTSPDAPFDEPWQAQVFGLTVALNESGLFAWSDWAETFSAELKPRQAAPGGEAPGVYWQAWLAALETMLTSRDIAEPSDIAQLAERWQAAAHATPHGTPIRLENAS